MNSKQRTHGEGAVERDRHDRGKILENFLTGHAGRKTGEGLF